MLKPGGDDNDDTDGTLLPPMAVRSNGKFDEEQRAEKPQSGVSEGFTKPLDLSRWNSDKLDLACNRDEPMISDVGEDLAAETESVPATCGARQLSKLKRFLTTLQQRALDISPAMADKVRQSVWAMVNGSISPEQFHHQLHDTSKFPLKPFIVSFLKANLPYLQRELLFLTHKSQYIFNRYAQQAVPGGVEQMENCQFRPFPAHPIDHAQDATVTNVNGEGHFNTKKTHQVRPRRQLPIVLEHHDRSQLNVPDPFLRMYIHNRFIEQPRVNVPDVHFFIEDGKRFSSEGFTNYDQVLQQIPLLLVRLKDCLQNFSHWSVEEKTDCLKAYQHLRENLNSNQPSGDNSLRQRLLDKQTLHKTKLENVCDEFKALFCELMQSITVLDQISSTMFTTERMQLERLLFELERHLLDNRQTFVNMPHESRQTPVIQRARSATSMVCWNCGRNGQEVCGGCKLANYCGAFCQERDWETHKKVCKGARLTPYLSAINSKDVARGAPATPDSSVADTLEVS